MHIAQSIVERDIMEFQVTLLRANMAMPDFHWYPLNI